MSEIILTKHIKIKDSDIVNYINRNEITHLYFEEGVIWNDKKNEIVILFRSVTDPEKKRKALELTRHKKVFYKIRTPSILRQFMGQKVKIFKDHFNGPEWEVFRIEPVKFSFRMKDPLFLKSGIFVIPKLYVNTVIQDRGFILTVSFDETNEQMVKDGYITAYLSNKNESGSIPLYKVGMGFRTKTVVRMLDMCGRCGNQLHDYLYAGTAHFDGYHQFGTMGFIHREIYGKTISTIRGNTG